MEYLDASRIRASKVPTVVGSTLQLRDELQLSRNMTFSIPKISITNDIQGVHIEPDKQLVCERDGRLYLSRCI
jgi:hypothetical protein